MPLPIWTRSYRVATAILTIYALYEKRSERPWDLHFYQFFTNQSAIVAASVLLLGGLVFAQREPPLWWDYVRGSAVMVSILTALIFAFVLDGLYNPFSDHSNMWQDTLFHQVLPIVMVADILIDPMSHRVTWWGILVFPLYPLAYLAYCIWVGQQTGWYAYAFMDPDRIGQYAPVGGWSGVAFANAVFLVGFVLISAFILRLNKVLSPSRA